VRETDDKAKRTAILADLMAGHDGDPSVFELQMWIRWADMVLFALAEYRARSRTDLVEILDRFVEHVMDHTDESWLEAARAHLKRHTTSGRPSLSHEDAKRLLQTDTSGNPYITDL
jgi:hypothetical protein